MTIYNLVEGWTDPIDCIIKADGVALSLTGITVAIVASDKNGSSVTMPGTVSVTDAAAGKVRYAPSAATDLLNSRSPMNIRWRLTDGSGKIRFVPNAPNRDKWIISLP